MIMRIRKCEPWLIFIASIFLFSLGHFDHEFIQFESRFGLFAQEMWRNGLSFFPTTYHTPYPDYPVTQTVLIYLVSLLFGKVTIYSAILPSAIAAATTLTLTYMLGATQSRSWGWYAVFFSLFTYEFFSAARSVTLDPFVMLATTLSFYFAYMAKLRQQVNRKQWVLIGLVLGFVFRGPIGLIIPAAVVGGFYFLERDYRVLLHFVGSALLLLVILMLMLMALAVSVDGWHFAKEVIWMQASGRIAESKTTPFFYVLGAFASYAISYPVALCVACIQFPRWIKPNSDEAIRLFRHLLFWTFIVIVGLSIPGTKKIRYILPIVPAISLMAGYLFVSENPDRLTHWLRQLIKLCCFVLPFLGLVMIPACLIVAQIRSLVINAHYFSAATLFVFEAIAVVILEKKWRQHAWHVPALLGVGLATFMTLNIFMVEPITVSLNRVQPFVEQVIAHRAAAQAIVFYRLGPDAEDVKFMVALDKPLQPLFVETPEQLLSMQSPALFIAKQDDFDALPADVRQHFVVLVTGKIGHRACVAFSAVKAGAVAPA